MSTMPATGFDLATRERSEAAFLEGNPDFAATAIVDELRASDYERLDAGGHVYLDYTGGSLYAQSQLDEHMAMLADTVYGNPHSVNPTSTASTVLVEEAYPFGPQGRFLELFDNHNSVNGIREFAGAKGAQTAYVPLEAPDLRVA